MPIPSDVAVRLRGLTVRRNGLTILQSIDADIPSGSSTVVIGPNGAGKSTLLLCIAGELACEGRVTFPASERPPRMAYVPQHVQLDAGLPLTVLEFMALGGQRRPLWLGVAASGRERALRHLERVQAAHLLQRRMGDLSGGEQRRVLLASALARRPRLLLLDEPAAGVDASGERLFWKVLTAARQEQGFTQIMVSHNLSLTAHYADLVLCLNGSLMRAGAPHAALTAPTLRALFGVPIHLYPEQCEEPDETCAQCGAHCHSADALTCPTADAAPPSSPAR